MISVLLAKIFILQTLWLGIALFARDLSVIFIIAMTLLVVLGNYLLYRPQKSFFSYIIAALVFLAAGYVFDYSLLGFNIIKRDSYTWSYLALWPIFLCYYGDLFNKFQSMHKVFLAILGGVGGLMAYWSCIRLGALELVEGKANLYTFAVGAYWAAFFPLSINFYYRGSKMLNRLLDMSIVFSFDKTGFARHSKEFSNDLNSDQSGAMALVTGATSGLGNELAKELSTYGIKVFGTGRNEQKGSDMEASLDNCEFVKLDLANWSDILKVCESLPILDYIVLNAGGMPQERRLNRQSVESQCASQLLGHYILISTLRSLGKLAKGARIVWVSSGGMYLKKLDLDRLFSGEDYDKVDVYANVKRAQVTLVEELSKLQEWSDFSMSAMHPGWVATSGLEEALPTFYKIMKNRLRSPKEGIDTVLWLLLAKEQPESGKFYFDRKKASPYMSEKYRPSLEQRKALLETVNDYHSNFLD